MRQNTIYKSTTNSALASHTFDYTGEQQIFTAPETGVYKLETWGAQGGGTNGGFGGYSSGYINLQKGIPLFINVGGSSTTMTGGYNGGGSGNSGNNSPGYGGGGATHIALSGGKLNNLQYSKDKIIIVAGGGGISWNNLAGGCGGGATGCNAYSHLSVFKISAGTQTSGYGFGLGQTITSIPSDASWGVEGRGGGGGYYGGYGQTSGGEHSNSGGAGGSGYIGNSSLYSKVMYCSNCTESSDESTKTVSTTCHSSTPTENCAKEGNGYAIINFYK